MKKTGPISRADALTPDAYRSGIRNLMIDPLGVAWATPNILVPYGGLKKIPKAALPAVYAKAQADANALFLSAEAVADSWAGADENEATMMSVAVATGLSGMVASWENKEGHGGRFRAAGRGRITAMIPANSRPLLMVEVIPRAGDSEPPHGILVACDDEAGLKLFPSPDAEDRWSAWIMDEPKRRIGLLLKNCRD